MSKYSDGSQSMRSTPESRPRPRVRWASHSFSVRSSLPARTVEALYAVFGAGSRNATYWAWVGFEMVTLATRITDRRVAERFLAL